MSEQAAVPFNLALHEHLLSQGYEYERMPDTFEDVGDGESGPWLIGGPDYDQYTGPDEYVYVLEVGTADREPRDLAREAYEAGM